MGDSQFSIISNPPYGAQVKSTNKLLKYTGKNFEYKAIEIGAILGASDGCFLIPQSSCPFHYSGDRVPGDSIYEERFKSSEYLKFKKQTGLEITCNIGIDTEIQEDQSQWKDVSVLVEFAIVEYDELDYKGQVKEQTNQVTLF